MKDKEIKKQLVNACLKAALQQTFPNVDSDIKVDGNEIKITVSKKELK